MRASRKDQLEHTLDFLNRLFDIAKNHQVVYPGKLARLAGVSSYTTQAVVDTCTVVFYRESPRALCRVHWVCGKEPDMEMAELVADKATLLKVVRPHKVKPMPEDQIPVAVDKIVVEINGVKVKVPKTDTLKIKVGGNNSLIFL